MQPHSIEAEQSVLGGLLLSADAWDAVAEIVSARIFIGPTPPDFSPDRTAGRSALSLWMSLPSPTSWKPAVSWTLPVACPIWRSLAQNTPSASNIRAYAQVVRERASLRKLIEAAQDIAESGFNPEGRTPTN